MPRNFPRYQGYARVTVTTTSQTLAELLTTAGALGGAIPAQCDLVWIQPETGDVRMRADGVAPTSTSGTIILQDQSWPLAGSVGNCRLIAAASTTVSLTFEGD